MTPKANRPALATMISGALLGLFALASNWTAGLQPVLSPIPADGQPHTFVFDPARSARYEIGLQLRAPADEDARWEIIRLDGKTSLDCGWQIAHDDGPDIRGDFQQALFTHLRYPKWSRWLAQLSAMGRSSSLTDELVARGGGSFQTHEGSKATLTVNLSPSSKVDLERLRPHIFVQIHRRDWDRRLMQTALLLSIATGLLGVGALWWWVLRKNPNLTTEQ